MNNIAWGFIFFCTVGEAANQFLDSNCTISDAGSCCAWIMIIEVRLVFVCHELLKLDSSREDGQDNF